MSKSKVVVVGSINMDLVVRAPRFALPGETILGNAFYTVPGGKGANQAVAARRIGADVSIVGRVGADAFGDTMRQNLSGEGISTEGLSTDEEASSGVALITVDIGGENTIIVVPGANGRLTGDDIEAARELITGANILLMQLEIPLPAVERAAAMAQASGVTVILNASPARVLPEHLLTLVDYLVVNESEARLLAGGNSENVSPEMSARSLQKWGIRNVVVTLGAEGLLLISDSNATIFVPAFAIDTVDTTAAGDAFTGGMAVALAEGRGAYQALRWGSAAGALAATREGAQPSLPTRTEVETFLHEREQVGNELQL